MASLLDAAVGAVKSPSLGVALAAVSTERPYRKPPPSAYMRIFLSNPNPKKKKKVYAHFFVLGGGGLNWRPIKSCHVWAGTHVHRNENANI